MIHNLNIGQLDPAAIRACRAVPRRPLNAARIDRVLAEFPGLKIERRDGYLSEHWHGREESERREAFAVRLQAEIGNQVANRLNCGTMSLRG